MMMQHNTTMFAAAAAPAPAKATKRGAISSLQGPRPLPLSVPGTTPPPSSSSSSPSRPAKRARVVNGGSDDEEGGVVGGGPVIVYEHTPKVIHARPDEFKALVQRLTGRQPTGTAGGGQEEAMPRRPAPQTTAAELPSSWSSQQDPLVLTLGQQQQQQQQHVPPPPPLPLPLADNDRHHHTPPPVLPSPSGAAGFLLSPGSFLFSPATMQAIQELIS